MKTCNKCGETKEFSEFRKCKRIKDGHRGHCKSCEPKRNPEYHRRWAKKKRETDPEWWEDRKRKNREWVKENRTFEQQKQYARTNRAKRYELSNSLKFPCIVCGEDDPVVLDWHHLDPSIKTDGVAAMISQQKPIEIIKKEIAKCTCLCANCHRRHHAGTIDIEPYLINHKQV